MKRIGIYGRFPIYYIDVTKKKIEETKRDIETITLSIRKKNLEMEKERESLRVAEKNLEEANSYITLNKDDSELSVTITKAKEIETQLSALKTKSESRANY